MTIKKIAFIFGLYLVIAQNTTYAADDKLATLRQYQGQQLASLTSRLEMPDMSIKALYHSTGERKPILILQKKHADIHSVQELQELFKSAGLKIVSNKGYWKGDGRQAVWISKWDEGDWHLAMMSLNERKNRTNESLRELIKRVKEEENEVDWEDDPDQALLAKIANEKGRKEIPLNDIKLLGDDAFAILESYLPPENNDLLELFLPPGTSDLEEDFEAAFIGKMLPSGPGPRLYTYTQIYKTIKAENLNHVRLPLKFLTMKNDKTGILITDPSKIREVLRKKIKTFVYDKEMLELSFSIDDQSDDDYSFYILAEKITNHNNLSLDALKELAELVKDAPFDVGHDNIFADEEGNAVIIDTEYKGAQTDEALAALGRYKPRL